MDRQQRMQEEGQERRDLRPEITVIEDETVATVVVETMGVTLVVEAGQG